MKGKTPNKAELKHMDRVSQIGCIVCKNQNKFFNPAEIHHIQGKTKSNAHYKTLPLCYEHHRMGSAVEPISRHPYKARFEKAYGTEEELLEEVNRLLHTHDYDNLPF